VLVSSSGKVYIGGDAIKSLIGYMLSSVAWRKVRSMLMKELEERPKLGMMKEIASLELESSCVENDDQAQRGHDSIPDRGGKLARSGEEGENMQGLPE